MLARGGAGTLDNAIASVSKLDAKTLSNCLARQQPVVFRSVVSHWPMVQAAQSSFACLSEYLIRFDSKVLMQAMIAKPQERGRIFYRSDFKAFNFQRMNGYLKDALDFLGDPGEDDRSPTFYLGSMEVPHYLPGLENDCILDALPKRVSPKIWIGNRVVVPTHNDNYENVACVTAGKRRFTLFPPEQEKNLYIADVSKTPAGRKVSMVDLSRPDLQRFPRFKEALDKSFVAELGPGDAIFIPYQWWHNVESLQNVNILVNFWWGKR